MMEKTETGLSEVLRFALYQSKNPDAPQFPWRIKSGSRSYDSTDPMEKMSESAVAHRAFTVVKNEERALQYIDQLSMDILHDALVATKAVPADARILSLLRSRWEPPSLIVMSSEITQLDESRLLHREELGVNRSTLESAVRTLPKPETSSTEGKVFEAVFKAVIGSDEGAGLELLGLSEPRIVLTRRPRMAPLCVPSPHFKIEAGTRSCTAGVLCRDGDGELGITTCYHGTGPLNTQVTVGLRESYVKHADQVQDIVFIPLGENLNLPELFGQQGALKDRAPAQADRVRFEGATSGTVQTRVQSHDAGLLRTRPTVQLKLQTPPDTNTGDSGCALVSASDEVLGFAFERTDYDDFPQFTDWIWASNALRALNLTPFTFGD